MKYRVIKEYGLLYPQLRRFLFFWTSTSDPISAYHTLDEALVDIEDHKKMFSKIHKVDVIWRS